MSSATKAGSGLLQLTFHTALRKYPEVIVNVWRTQNRQVPHILTRHAPLHGRPPPCRQHHADIYFVSVEAVLPPRLRARVCGNGRPAACRSSGARLRRSGTWRPDSVGCAPVRDCIRISNTSATSIRIIQLKASCGCVAEPRIGLPGRQAAAFRTMHCVDALLIGLMTGKRSSIACALRSCAPAAEIDASLGSHDASGMPSAHQFAGEHARQNPRFPSYPGLPRNVREVAIHVVRTGHA